MPRLHVAVLDEELPFPLTSGKRIRSFQLLARLATRHRVTILCHRNPQRDEALAAEEVFRACGIETIVVDRAIPAKSGPGFYARLAGNLFSHLPYSVATHTSQALIQAVREYAHRQAVDLWHCEWTPYAQVLREALGPQLPATPWCVMAHNVESRIWQRLAATAENPAKRWYIQQQWRKFQRFERWAYSHAPACIAVSQDDAALMQTEFAARSVFVVDNGVDGAYFQPQRDVERHPAQMLFLGSLDWRPNQDAAVLLLEEILPQVRRSVPNATAVLVGRRPPPWLVAQVRHTPGAELYADVADVRPFLARCGFLIVPLRIGGGSRLKILEALAAGTPVLSTRVGAEGLELTSPRDLWMAANHEELVRMAITAIRQPEVVAETVESARPQVLSRYSWDVLAQRLDDVWLQTARQPLRR
ncbi:MAG: glycosyltransferase [Gemmataceae bacterium]|nr:glycosyltransferase family 4 protein [Gemmata sp.]MDW8198947.1 glycosyltransferase [Gemmataceae bacterium]